MNTFIEGNKFYLHKIFSTYKGKNAVKLDRNTLTYDDWAYHLIYTIQELKNLKINSGDRIAIYTDNSFEYLNIIFAAWISKVVVIPLSIRMPAEQILELKKEYNIKHIIVTKPINMDYLGIPIHQFSKSFRRRGRGAKRVYNLTYNWSIPLDQEATIIFTSGSTGKPKGIVHTVGNYLYSALGSIEYFKMEEGETSLLSLPLYHVGGLLIPFRSFLSGGILILPATLSKIGSAIRGQKPDFISLVSTQLIRLINKDIMIPRLRLPKVIMVGGGPVPRWVVEFCQDKKIPIVLTYGLTESTAQMTATPLSSLAQSHQCVGRPLPYRELKLSQDNEIMIRGKTLFKGYADGASHIVTPFDQEGWFSTKDIGRFTENGELEIHERKDLMFISGGENIHPHTIEENINRIPWVVESIVVPIPHAEYGEVPFAFIETARKIPLKKVILHLKDILPSFMIPKKIVFLDPENKFKGLKYNREALKSQAKKLAIN